MAVTFESNDAYGKRRVFCFHAEPEQRDVAGYKLSGVSEGTFVPQGTPIVANDNDTNGQKTATICKYAVIKSKTTTKKFIVESLGFLAVGDKIFKSGQENPTLSTIESINKSTNEITLAAANSQLEAGDIAVEGVSETTGEGTEAVTVIKEKNIPNRIVLRGETMRVKNQTISATHRCIAIKNVLNYPAEWLNTTAFPGSTLLRGCPLILFINQ